MCLYTADKVIVGALIRKVIVAVTEHSAGTCLLRITQHSYPCLILGKVYTYFPDDGNNHFELLWHFSVILQIGKQLTLCFDGVI